MVGRKKPRCTYATLKTGADRTAAFKKHITKMLNGGKKKKKKRIIGPNHVSQIMKRRAAKARAEKKATEEVHRTAYERRQREERNEAFCRSFFGTTPQMEYEKRREAEVAKMQEEQRQKILDMSLKEYIEDRSKVTVLATGFNRRANIIRLAWKCKMRRLTKKRNRRVHWNEIPETVIFDHSGVSYFNILKIIK